MKQLACFRTMSTSKLWVPPEHDADPATEIRSGDLYLLTSAAALENSTNNSNNNNAKRRSTLAGRYPVHVKVYRSCFGHYAVVTASLRAPATYLNLRTCNCRPCGGVENTSATSSTSTSPSSSSSSNATRIVTSDKNRKSGSGGGNGGGGKFRVELGGGEGQVIYFEVGGRESAGVDEWVRAFQGVVCPSPGTISPALSPVIPRSPIMPTLQESLEEEEEEEVENGLG